jgi:hypothetical protein
MPEKEKKMNPEEAFESFRQALRESSLKDDPTGDFGVEAAVAAFDECLSLAYTDRLEASAPRTLASAAYCEITEADIDKPLFTAFGRHWPVANFMGHINRNDIGKRVFLRDDVLQVESDGQRTERLKGS